MRHVFIQGIGSNWFAFGCLCDRPHLWQSGFSLARISFLDSNLTGAGLSIVITCEECFSTALLVYWNSLYGYFQSLCSGWTLMKRPKSIAELTKFLTDFPIDSWATFGDSGVGILAGIKRWKENVLQRVCSAKMKDFIITEVLCPCGSLGDCNHIFRHSPAVLRRFFARIFRRPVLGICTFIGKFDLSYFGSYSK